MANFLKKIRSTFTLGSLRQWHWISSALCLVGMLLFSLTGITLNHATQIKASPKLVSLTAQLPQELIPPESLNPAANSVSKAPLPTELIRWLNNEKDLPVTAENAEWRQDEIYLALPRPGGDAWLSIDRETGELLYESTDRGWISYFNDLHKGRNTGQVWSLFIDIFAIACIVFCITGFILLQRYASVRPTTWPIVALGIVLPWVLILLFMH